MLTRLIVLSLLAAAALPGALLQYSGTFATDDELVLLKFEITGPGTVDIRTTSAGLGGFDPYLSLFEAGGLQLLLALNEDEAGCGGCLDAALTFATPGSYILVVTQSGNFPFGPTLADGFSMAGAGNFTGGPFLDIFGETRTGDWAVEISGPVEGEVPEPGTAMMIAGGLGLAALAGRRKMAG